MNPAEKKLPSRLLPRDSVKPTPEWLAAKLAIFLGIYWEDRETTPEYSGRLETWCKCLLDLPQTAIDAAIDDRLKSSDRRKPIPGEIREAALSKLEPRPSVPVIEASEPEKKIVTAEQAARIVEKLEMTNNTFAQNAVRALQMREASDNV